MQQRAGRGRQPSVHARPYPTSSRSPQSQTSSRAHSPYGPPSSESDPDSESSSPPHSMGLTSPPRSPAISDSVSRVNEGSPSYIMGNSGHTVTSPGRDVLVEKWMRGPSLNALQVRLREMKAGDSDIDYFYNAIGPDPALNKVWATKAQPIAAAVLDAVQAEVAANHRELEKSRMLVDFVTRRKEILEKQMEAARMNKVKMDLVCEMLEG